MSEKYVVKRSDELGRYMVASVELQPGEVILEETPLVVGPKQNSRVICLGCYAAVDGREGGDRCSDCGWPLCSKCASDDAVAHKKGECKIFAEARAKFQSLTEEDAVCLQLDCVTPLRLLLAKESQPKRWKEEIDPMEDHAAERKGTEAWRADEINVVGYLRNPCKLKSRFSAELIMRAIGVLEINAFEGRTANGDVMRCIYPKTAIMAHNCIPNTAHSVKQSENFKLQLRTTVKVLAGSQLNSTYAYTLQGTLERQAHLKSGKYFTCQCNRCKDPTELGINFSSILCRSCHAGCLSATAPLEVASDWKCPKCEFVADGNAINHIVARIQKEADALQTMQPAEMIENSERLLSKYEQLLHRNHYILVSLRQSLVETYGRVPGFMLSQLPLPLMERKIQMCKDTLSILDVFEPGLTRARGYTLFELYAPIVMIAKWELEQKQIDQLAFNAKLKTAMDALRESEQILSLEDAISAEGMLAEIARKALRQLEVEFLTDK